MPISKVSNSTPSQYSDLRENATSNARANAAPNDGSPKSHPQLSGLPASPRRSHTVAQVQDFAASVFAATIGNSPKVVGAISTNSALRQLRSQPATSASMTTLSAYEHQLANSQGPSTLQDKIAAAAGYARNGAAHVAATNAALGAGGLQGVHSAGYLDDLLENVGGPHS